MRPALEPGDRVVAVRCRRRVRVGDLVVVPDPRLAERLVVKRVVELTPVSVTVRGDNAAASTDSRTFGPVPRARVHGRVVYRYHPPSRRGPVGRRRPGRPVP
jgi:nickel-type superoxide dismutase maturation protease